MPLAVQRGLLELTVAPVPGLSASSEAANGSSRQSSGCRAQGHRAAQVRPQCAHPGPRAPPAARCSSLSSPNAAKCACAAALAAARDLPLPRAGERPECRRALSWNRSRSAASARRAVRRCPRSEFSPGTRSSSSVDFPYPPGLDDGDHRAGPCTKVHAFQRHRRRRTSSDAGDGERRNLVCAAPSTGSSTSVCIRFLGLHRRPSTFEGSALVRRAISGVAFLPAPLFQVHPQRTSGGDMVRSIAWIAVCVLLAR